METYSVFLRADSAGKVLAVESSAFLPDTVPADWVRVDEGAGDRYHHAQGNYFAQPLMNMDGTHAYVLASGKVRAATAEELAAERAALAAGAQARPTVEARVAATETRLDETQLALCEIYEQLAGGTV